jgi:uncharacterized protein YegP (UPF0339 family)
VRIANNTEIIITSQLAETKDEKINRIYTFQEMSEIKESLSTDKF